MLAFFIFSIFGIPIVIVLVILRPFSSGSGSILPVLDPIFPVRVVGSAFMLPDSGTAPAIIAVGRDPANSQYAIDRFDINSHKVVWGALSQKDYLPVSALVSGDTYVYVVIKNRLVALQASDGKQAWEASLPDILSGGCIRCILVLNGQVIVHTSDDSLGAYDASTGHQTWEKQLNNAGDTLYPAGDAVALAYWVDSGATLGVFDTGSGSERVKIEPVCKSDNNMPDEMEVYSKILVDGSGSTAKAYITNGAS